MDIKSLKILLDYRGDVQKYEHAIKRWVYFIVIIYITRYAWQILHGGNGFKTGDWLINYQGGFVRRGLIGQLLFDISSFGTDLLWLVFAVQSAIYIALAYLILDFFFDKPRNTSYLLFLFSPAFIFLFPFYDIPGGFRKEILVYLSFSLLLAGLKKNNQNHYLIAISLLVYILGVFSHEMAVFTLPYFIYLLYNSWHKNEKNKSLYSIYIILFTITAIIGIATSMLYHGDQNIVYGITESLIKKGLTPKAFGGSVPWLIEPIHVAISKTLSIMISNNYEYYLHPILLALLPVIYFGYHKENLFIMIVSLVFMAPLFITGMDWGRWICIWIFFIYTHLLASDNYMTKYKVPLYWVIIYASIWSIHHFGIGNIGLGIVEAFR